MKFLIIADPVSKLLPKTDTGLCMLREALKRGHDVAWAISENVCLVQGRAFVKLDWVKKCDPQRVPQFYSSADRPDFIPISDFDGVWIRKDPPFDSSYISLCWMLSLEEKSVSFINRPTLLLQHHEKLIPFQAYRAGALQAEELVPTWLAFEKGAKKPDQLALNQLSFLKGETISKPWLGFGGASVDKWKTFSEFLRKKPFKKGDRFMVQPFIKEISTLGDRRVFFIDGEYQGDFVRLPPKGKIVSNLARGGSALTAPLSEVQKDLVKRLGSYLKSVGIVLAGADMIGTRISEVNITAPTGFVKFEELYGVDLTEKYLDVAEQKLI